MTALQLFNCKWKNPGSSPALFFWRTPKLSFRKHWDSHLTLLLTEDLRFVCTLTESQIILTKTLHRHGSFAFASKLTDVWPKGVCGTVVLALNLCFFSGGIAKGQMIPTLAQKYNSLWVLFAHEPLIKGSVPLDIVNHGFTFAKKLLKVTGRKDIPVANQRLKRRGLNSLCGFRQDT